MTSRRSFLASALAAPAVLALAGPAAAVQSPPILAAQRVSFSRDYAEGSIVILPRAYFLYHVTAPGEAMRYGIAVARPGLGFTGTAVIGRKVEWPSWRPTPDMIERDPDIYGKFKGNTDRMPGGPGNPLGARALYLYQDGRDTAIRIHGTTQPNSIGRNASSGCFRMLNENVISLYEQVPTGTPVTVL
ncbi:putative L,D-transpeptidase YnhG precursor [Pseudooceanicola marinus]|uniref:Putative L,D-transpeptidase YnhG n=1 Tax=Pseudooceanicola marinus TaxID=396013 RepID=A0A1X6ZZZ1_9RHOB|nr:L,D-transpeptidase [Pseudooceanicola marinus]PJE30182.1 L,D-transpeptidase [Pseudooceanicola marinus]SLN66483.1 putative L,D-transpeptidase YnhG precursor [Pseudooceanicola marinus]